MRGLSFWQDTAKVNQRWASIGDSGKFVDSEFPATTESLWIEGYSREITAGLGQKYKAVTTWKRPSELVRPASSSMESNSLTFLVGPCMKPDCSDYRGN